MAFSYLVSQNANFTNFTDPVINPPYQPIYEWEKFNHLYWQEWMARNWTVTFYISAVYVAVIFGIKHWMKDREPFQLKNALIVWNIGLALFSAAAFYRTFSHFVNILVVPDGGLHVSICSRKGMALGQQFWILLGTWSKVVELGDTIFIVLRKRPLIFLHWYHHIITMVLSFHGYEAVDPYSRWLFPMNLSIHVVMYSYYALRAAGYKIPLSFAMSLTTVQILQMIIGVSLNLYSLYALGKGWDCQRKEVNIYFHLATFASFFALFAKFFVDAYFRKSRRLAEKKQKVM